MSAGAANLFSSRVNVATGRTFDASTQICFGGDCSNIKSQNFNYQEIQIEYKSYNSFQEGLGKVLSGTEARKKSIFFIFYHSNNFSYLSSELCHG